MCTIKYMHALASLLIVAMVVEPGAADDLKLMQLHAELTKNTLTSAQDSHITTCEGVDCDIVKPSLLAVGQTASEGVSEILDDTQIALPPRALESESAVEGEAEVGLPVRVRKSGKWKFGVRWISARTGKANGWSENFPWEDIQKWAREATEKEEDVGSDDVDELVGKADASVKGEEVGEDKEEGEEEEDEEDDRSVEAKPIHVQPLPGENYQLWGLCNATFHSNIAGLGPDEGEPVLRYYNVSHVVDDDGNMQVLDLVVENVGHYEPFRAEENGLIAPGSCFGNVNLKSSRSGTVSMTMRFNWYLAGTTTPAVPPKVFFTIYDIDGNSKSSEAITFYNRVHDVYTANNTLLNMSGDLDNGLTFSASGLPTNVAMPMDPENLTEDQQNRAVTVSYVQKSKFKLTFSVTGGRRGRNFAFTGHSVLASEPTPAPTPETVPPSRGDRPTGGDSESTPAPTSETVPPRGADRPTGTEPEGEEQCKDCIIWGDPHIITFQAHEKRLRQHPAREAFFRTHGWKSDQLSVAETGTYWLMKTHSVQIQGRYWKNAAGANTTGLGAIAVGGSFLRGNLLIIRTEVGKVMWNDEKILQATPSEFHNDVVHATYSNEAELVAKGKTGTGLVVRLPEGIKLTVNRWRRSLDAKISVCGSVTSEVSGQCGRLTPALGDELSLAAEALKDWRAAQKLTREESIFPDGRPIEAITAKFFIDK